MGAATKERGQASESRGQCAKKNPSRKKDDWVSEVQDDLKNCNINYSDEEIKTMSKCTFKRIIREAIDLKVMSYLIEIQGKHSKSKIFV